MAAIARARSGSAAGTTPSHEARGADVPDNTNSNGPRLGPGRARIKRGPPPGSAIRRTPPAPAIEGLKTRDAAVSALFSVLIEHRPFDDVFARVSAARDLAPRDRAFARL